LGSSFWERVDRLTALRRAEQAQMQAYVDLPFGEHMGFLIRALDGDPCTVTPPPLPPPPSHVDPTLVREAIAFLRRTSIPIEPRKKWPTAGLPSYHINGCIPETRQPEEGRAPCMWRDAGWGRLLYEGKYHYNHFADELVSACVEMVRSWQPRPAPEWVTCIPSLRRPQLVPAFSQRLAKALDLPFHAVLERVAERPEQKTMANSVQQARNLD
jgi:ATP-dependent DNA helicase RecQ